jgi:hypothetical protein
MMGNKLRNSKNKAINTFTVAIMLMTSSPSWALNADFALTASYSRNKKIWGTYKLNQEKMSIKRGKKKWFKEPTQRVGDIIISGGHIIFVRETLEEGKTKIVVDKIPYKKVGSYTYINRDPLDHEVMNRLYKPDIRAITPHRDLLDGEIHYDKLECKRNRRNLKCTLNGNLIPQS